MRYYFNLAAELYLVKLILFKLKHFEKMPKSLHKHTIFVQFLKSCLVFILQYCTKYMQGNYAQKYKM